MSQGWHNLTAIQPDQGRLACVSITSIYIFHLARFSPIHTVPARMIDLQSSGGEVTPPTAKNEAVDVSAFERFVIKLIGGTVDNVYQRFPVVWFTLLVAAPMAWLRTFLGVS